MDLRGQVRSCHTRGARLLGGGGEMCLPSLRVSPRMEATSVVYARSCRPLLSRATPVQEPASSLRGYAFHATPASTCLWDLSIALVFFFEIKVFSDLEHVSRVTSYSAQPSDTRSCKLELKRRYYLKRRIRPSLCASLRVSLCVSIRLIHNALHRSQHEQPSFGRRARLW